MSGYLPVPGCDQCPEGQCDFGYPCGQCHFLNKTCTWANANADPRYQASSSSQPSPAVWAGSDGSIDVKSLGSHFRGRCDGCSDAKQPVCNGRYPCTRCIEFGLGCSYSPHRTQVTTTCKPCFKFGRKCNGENPCDTCVRLDVASHCTSRAPTCINCRTDHQVCNGRMPCERCYQNDLYCNYF